MMKKILLIEDETALRESIAQVLGFESYDVYTAADGKAGIAKALESYPDIILCDISLPEADGYEVYQKIQENKKLATVPFIFITARAEKEDIRLGLQLGADDYITKPFDFDDLLQTIKRRLEKKKQLVDSIEENYLPLIDNPMVGIFLIDNYQIIFANQTTLKFLKAKNLPENMQLSEIVHKDDFDFVSNRIFKCIKGFCKNFEGQVKITNLKGETQSFSVSFTITPSRGEKSFIGMIIPINEKLNTNETTQIFKQGDEELAQQISEKYLENDPFKKNISNSALVKLTKRENEILKFICQGASNQEIAEKLFISPRTVDGHRCNLLSKTGTKNTASLVSYAFKNNLLS